MNELWTWPATSLVIGFAGISLIYPIYHYLLQAPQWRRRLANRYSGESLEIASIVAQRVVGGLWMVVAALVVGAVVDLSPAALGLTLGDPLRTLIWVLAPAVLLLPLIWRGAGQPKRRELYPQLRITHWSSHRQRQNALAWGAYLFGYELFFRGFCLIWLVQQFGFWPGVFASSALYAYAHLHKDAGETFGSIAMGVLFALMTLHSGSIWAAVLLHWMIAVTGEQSAIMHNPAYQRN